MKKLLLVLTALAFAAPVVPAPMQGNATMQHTQYQDERKLAELYHAFNRAMTAANTASLDQMLAPDFTLTHMTGYQQSRTEWLEHVQSGKMRYHYIDEVSVRASVNGDSARIIGQAWNDATIWGAQGRWPLQLDISLLRHGNGWLITQAVASTF